MTTFTFQDNPVTPGRHLVRVVGREIDFETGDAEGKTVALVLTLSFQEGFDDEILAIHENDPDADDWYTAAFPNGPSEAGLIRPEWDGVPFYVDVTERDGKTLVDVVAPQLAEHA